MAVLEDIFEEASRTKEMDRGNGEPRMERMVRESALEPVCCMTARASPLLPVRAERIVLNVHAQVFVPV